MARILHFIYLRSSDLCAHMDIVYYEMDMGKEQEKKPAATEAVHASIQNSEQSESLTHEQWTQHMPQWLREIRTAVDRGDASTATMLLKQEHLQERLAKINDANSRYFTSHEIALLCFAVGLFHEALNYCSEALDMHEDAKLFNLAGLIHSRMNQNTLAIQHFSRAIQLKPDRPAMWNNLGLCLMKVGRAIEAINLFRNVVAADPQHAQAYSNLLLHLNYLPGVARSELYEEAKTWASIQVPSSLACQSHDNVLQPDRKLRIGYISPDFREHSVMFFFESLLLGHNRECFEIFGYGNVPNMDSVTESAIERFDSYRNIRGADHRDVAHMIESDQIDILVELAGHTQGNSLKAIAYKPAPIQVSYLGYPNTTGMKQIDYRLTDALADNEDQQAYYTEKLISLPNGFLCYNPGNVQPTVMALPASVNDFITFGCFSNISKINPELMRLWIRLLDALPNSRLMLKFGEVGDTQVKEYYLNLFQALGLANARGRIVLANWLPSPKHLELYNSVDIALDTYPYNGTTTTCQALLMGVPVISLRGQAHASRVGFDILSRLDLQFFAAQTETDYVNKAIALASSPEALTKLRATMRQRLAASPLCNYRLITHDIESAYRKMWRDYCDSQSSRELDYSQKPSPQEQACKGG